MLERCLVPVSNIHPYRARHIPYVTEISGTRRRVTIVNIACKRNFPSGLPIPPSSVPFLVAIRNLQEN